MLIRTAKEDKSIHSDWTWWVYHLHSGNHFEKRLSLFFPLFKQKPLSEMDGKYVLAADAVVILRAEWSQFCRLCHRDVGQPLEWMYGRIWATAAPSPSLATASRWILFRPDMLYLFTGIFLGGRRWQWKEAVLKPSSSPSYCVVWLSHLSAHRRCLCCLARPERGAARGPGSHHTLGSSWIRKDMWVDVACLPAASTQSKANSLARFSSKWRGICLILIAMTPRCKKIKLTLFFF